MIYKKMKQISNFQTIDVRIHNMKEIQQRRVSHLIESLREKKVMMIGTVAEITGLSERQIRYYEQKKLIFPFRTATGNRKYSFSDIEKLIEIAEKVEEGVRTSEILEDLNRTERSSTSNKELIQGQINSHFRQSGRK